MVGYVSCVILPWSQTSPLRTIVVCGALSPPPCACDPAVMPSGMARERSKRVAAEVRSVPAGDDGVAVECWERVTDDEDRRVWAQLFHFLPGVYPSYRETELRGWNVTVAVMEFIRWDPLRSELRTQITAALRVVEGVETADEMDTEVWWVSGTPKGPALVQAVAAVLDDYDGRIRAYLERLKDPDFWAGIDLNRRPGLP
jgi:hypothetical protein